MVEYSIASTRAYDGAKNHVVMNGNPGYLGQTSIYLKYLMDGYISLSGDNLEDYYGWKLLSQFTMAPGKYTLTGIKNVSEGVIALQLHIDDGTTDGSRYIYQWDEEVSVEIERETHATLHVMVYPRVEYLDIIARPAVYRND